MKSIYILVILAVSFEAAFGADFGVAVKNFMEKYKKSLKCGIDGTSLAPFL